MSSYNNLITERKALATHSQAQIKLYLAGARSSVDVAMNNGQEDYENVAATSLQDYAQSQGFDLADLILLDIEGSELNVLQGAGKLLSSKPNLILEVNRPGLLAQSKSPNALYQFLSALGYQLYFIADEYLLTVQPEDTRKIVLQPIQTDDGNFQPKLKAFNILATCRPDTLQSPEIVIRTEWIGSTKI